MIVSTIILTKDNFYINETGKLPSRPDFDKQLLTTLAKGQSVSLKGFNMLPPSIRRVVTKSHEEPTFPVTIKEIDALTDLLIVVHSHELIVRGSQFRFSNFELLSKGKHISIWKRK